MVLYLLVTLVLLSKFCTIIISTKPWMIKSLIARGVFPSGHYLARSKFSTILFFRFIDECLRYFKSFFTSKLQMFWSLFHKKKCFYTSTSGAGNFFQKNKQTKKEWKKRGIEKNGGRGGKFFEKIEFWAT